MTDDHVTTFVDFVRHGEVDGGEYFRGQTDDALTARGWQQMQAALDSVSPWQVVISSPLRRCADFARQWANDASLPIVIEDQLQEMNFGEWEGRTATSLMVEDAERIADFWRDPIHHTPPGGENVCQLQQRVLTAWRHLIHHNKGKHLLVISHGGPIRVILAHILDMPLEALLRLELPYAAVSRVRVTYSDKQPPFASLVFHSGKL